MERAQNLVWPGLHLCKAKVERLDGRRLPHEIQPHEVDRVFAQQSAGFYDIAEALAHLVALFVKHVPLKQERLERRYARLVHDDVFHEQSVCPAPCLIDALSQKSSRDEVAVFLVSERSIRGGAAVVPSVQHERLSLHYCAALAALYFDSVDPRPVKLKVRAIRQFSCLFHYLAP